VVSFRRFRPVVLGTALAAGVLTASATACGGGEGLEATGRIGGDERPNIVYIMADDLGYADLGAYGRRDYATPTLDALAAQGMRFSDAYAIAPLCTPTRVGLMTGRYPARDPVGLWEPLTTSIEQLTGLRTRSPTLSMLLREAGYETGLFGKWHLGMALGTRPPDHGFDVSFGPLTGAIDYVSHVGLDGQNNLFLNGVEVRRDGYVTDLVTEEASAFLRNASEPFFLSLQYTTPHWPWQTPRSAPYPEDAEWDADGGSPEIFAEMVRSLDESVGSILDLLDELGHAENTLVVFTSDNGGERWSDMTPFRGQKAELWEGGIRVPAFARWPGEIDAGVASGQVVTTLDWTATMLAAARIEPAEDLDGIDLLPHLRGEAPERERTVFWRAYQRQRHRAVRHGRWKYLRIDPLGEIDADVAGEYLFDLADDPGESRNLIDRRPEIAALLRELHAGWESEMLDPIPLPWGSYD
jgi:arylsulfatase A-like enzyme